MTALYIVVPLALLVAAGAVGAFIWTVRSGQLDDVDTPPRRILFDDDGSETKTLRTADARAHALRTPSTDPGA
jgi:cbb3-type cytochrome oxidase maturation protein